MAICDSGGWIPTFLLGEGSPRVRGSNCRCGLCSCRADDQSAINRRSPFLNPQSIANPHPAIRSMSTVLCAPHECAQNVTLDRDEWPFAPDCHGRAGIPVASRRSPACSEVSGDSTCFLCAGPHPDACQRLTSLGAAVSRQLAVWSARGTAGSARNDCDPAG